MALTTTTGIPDTIVKGDAYEFQVNNSDFPVATWTTATIYFKHGTDAILSFAGVASGAYHVFTLTNANTDTLFAGRNLVSVSWSDGTYRGSGDWTEINVLENPTAAGTLTTAATILAAIEAALLSNAGKSAGSVSADGVSFTWRSMKELQDGQVSWKAEVLKEQKAADAARGIFSPRIRATFTC